VKTIDLLDLYASLTLDTKAYENSLDSAEAHGKKTADSIGESMKKGGQTASKAATTVASSSVEAVKHVASGVKSIVTSTTNATQKIISGAISATSKLTSAVANVGKIAAGVGAAGLGVASAATAKMGKDAFEAYGEYEQLAGGINTLFGEGGTASKALMTYADNAFATVQMSANQYMQTVTDFSASLLQSLDEDAAADKADQALRQIADNSNKMGTAMSSVTDAYKGFAKDNFTMLDNLKLGFGGTAGEMARLVNESGVMNGEIEATAENVKDIPFDKIIDAIGVIQERLGMAGTSQEEALKTIQGSINMTKAAWENLLTGFANPDADLNKLVDDVMTSLDAVQENALPAVERILDSAGNAVVKFAPKLSSRVTSLVQNTAPSLLRAATSLMTTAGSVVLNTIPDVVDNAVDTVVSLIEGADGNAIIDSVVDVATRVTNTATRAISRIITKGLETIQANPQAIVDTIAYIVETAASTLADLIDSVDGDTVVASVIDLATRIVGTATRYVPRIINKALSTIRANGGQIRAGIKNIATQIITTFSEMLQNGDINEIAATFTDIWLDVVEILATNAPQIIEGMFGILNTVISTALNRIQENPQGFVQTCVNIFGAIISGAASLIGSILPQVGSVITSIFNGGFDNVDTSPLGERLNTILGGLFDGVTGLNPESVVTFCTNAVTQLVNGLAPAIETAIPAIGTFIASLTTQFTNEENTEKLKNAGTELLTAITNGFSTLAEEGTVTTIRQNVVKAVTNFVDWLTEQKQLDKMIDTGIELVNNLSDGLDDDVSSLITAAGRLIDNIIKHLTSDFNLSRILAAGISLGANLATGIINGLGDLLGGGLREVFAFALQGTMSEDELKKWKEDWNKSWDENVHLDAPTADELFKMGRWVDKEFGGISEDEYLKLTNSMNPKDYVYTGKGQSGYETKDTHEAVSQKVIVMVDGRVLGETDDQYEERKSWQYGY